MVEKTETGNCNILLGPGAGFDITDESYQFGFAVSWSEPEYRTTMTPEEYKVVHAVVTRALENKIERSISWQKKKKTNTKNLDS